MMPSHKEKLKAARTRQDRAVAAVTDTINGLTLDDLDEAEGILDTAISKAHDHTRFLRNGNVNGHGSLNGKGGL